jgi:hypothetical protein
LVTKGRNDDDKASESYSLYIFLKECFVLPSSVLSSCFTTKDTKSNYFLRRFCCQRRNTRKEGNAREKKRDDEDARQEERTKGNPGYEQKGSLCHKNVSVE